MTSIGGPQQSVQHPRLSSIADTEMASLGGSELLESCFRLQYFPSVKKGWTELPPVFDTISLTDELATKLAGAQPQAAPPVRLRTRRFDGLVRNLAIPHPVPYCKFVLNLHRNWNHLAPFLSSPTSMVKPARHGRDHRLIVMNYDRPAQMSLMQIKAAQGKRYRVTADVSNFFPSIYTHSVDWALRGADIAKADQSGRSWQSKIDRDLRACQDNETNGIAIGPATSNVISEILLQRVDQELIAKFGPNFIRYVDDYTSYFGTLEEAENFVHSLDRGLISYRLSLNTRKTRITPLDGDFGEEWIEELQIAKPSTRGTSSLIRYLQVCERLAKKYPDKSVMTYGAKVALQGSW